MPINPHLCSYCNEKRSCVAISLQGKPAHKIFVENKKDPLHPIEKWDKDCRFLCFYCIRENLGNVKSRILKVASENFFHLKPPLGYSTLIYKGDVFLTRPNYWDRDHFAWKMTLEPGEYICLFLGGSEPKHRAKKDLSTPLFGDLSRGMDLFDNNQK